VIWRLDEIFWKEIACTDCGRIFSEVNPVGGGEKVKAVEDAARRSGTTLCSVLYVGDSITDQEAFRLVQEQGGLTVSFNGNQYAVRSAEIAVLSENSIVTGVIAEAFIRSGKEETLKLVERWSRESLKKSPVNKSLLQQLFRLYPRKLPKTKIINSNNREALAKESTEFRRKVRGEAIGGLG
jgi:energy-converting hydrogenase A subunit R